MVNRTNVELLYDYIDQSSMLMYEKLDFDYLKGITESCKNILEQTILQDLNEDDKTNLLGLYKSIADIDFKKEEIRKALQLCILKGYKHQKISNSSMTPDTVGILLGYLVNKFYEEDNLVIFDPLVGTANLLVSIANNISKSSLLLGVDDNFVSYNIAKIMCEMTDYDYDIFYQDTLTFSNISANLIVCDMPNVSSYEEYFPYLVIKHHLKNLKDGGYFITIIDNDFFEKENTNEFKKQIDKSVYISGLIKLPDSMFTELGKSILIMQKKGENVHPVKEFLLVDLPSFDNLEEVNNTIKKIELWFLNK